MSFRIHYPPEYVGKHGASVTVLSGQITRDHPSVQQDNANKG